MLRPDGETPPRGHRSAATVGCRPLRERNSSTASTRPSTAPEATSRRPHASSWIPGSDSTASSSSAFGHQQRIPRGRTEQRARAPSSPWGAAPHRAASSSPAAAAGRSCRCLPPGAPRSAAVPRSRPPACRGGRAPCPRRRSSRSAVAASGRCPCSSDFAALAAAARAIGLPGWAYRRTLPIPAGTVSPSVSVEALGSGAGAAWCLTLSVSGDWWPAVAGCVGAGSFDAVTRCSTVGTVGR